MHEKKVRARCARISLKCEVRAIYGRVYGVATPLVPRPGAQLGSLLPPEIRWEEGERDWGRGR